MRVFLIALLSVLALSTTTVANAGNPHKDMCKKDGWRSSQAGNGAAFTSQRDCSKSKEAFQPSLVLSVSHVNPYEPFTADGAGFHADSAVTITISVTGGEPYITNSSFVTDAQGAVSAGIQFTGCGGAPPYDLTIRIVDAYGVSASARITVC